MGDKADRIVFVDSAIGENELVLWDWVKYAGEGARGEDGGYDGHIWKEEVVDIDGDVLSHIYGDGVQGFLRLFV